MDLRQIGLKPAVGQALCSKREHNFVDAGQELLAKVVVCV